MKKLRKSTKIILILLGLKKYYSGWACLCRSNVFGVKYRSFCPLDKNKCITKNGKKMSLERFRHDVGCDVFKNHIVGYVTVWVEKDSIENIVGRMNAGGKGHKIKIVKRSKL